MKFVMISKDGDGCHLLWKIAQEGNEVELHITGKNDKDVWEGILPKVDTVPLDKEAIYIFDTSGNAKIADGLITRGYYVVGSSSLADKLEFDRGKGIDIMHDIGMKIPETHTFKKFDEGIDFVKKFKKRVVFKPSGKDLPCHLSHCQEEGEDIVRYMKWVEKSYDIDEFEIQEFIEGVAISTEGFFNGFHFVMPFNHTIEHKKFANEELGPATGCSGNVVWACEEDTLAKDLRKLEPVLQGKYIGPIDINMIVSESGNYGLEWTPRFGYDSTCSETILFRKDIGQFFSDLARNQFEGEIDWSSDFAAAIRVTIPPYPIDDVEVKSGLPIQGIKNLNDYYFYEIAADENEIVHCGSAGVLLCTLAKSDDFSDSILQATGLADELVVPNKQYRTDLDSVLYDDYKSFSSLIEVKSA